ncbi:MAG TPA: hypothetical protein PK546_00050 [Chitinophagales bacterium]|nr:hypothetical protein [Chitinophagales bacterium]
MAAISVLWSNEAKLNGENTEAAKKYAEAKLLLTERIKAEEAATGDNRRNVGNYTQSILEAGKSMGIFGGTFGNIIGSLQGMQGSLVAIRGGLTAASGGATGFAGAMNVVKVAIASTGIGLLVIAIGLLVAWLSKIDPVVDKTQQVFAAFGAAIDVVKTTILKFVDGIKSVGDLMSKLGTIIANPIDSFKQLAGSMAVAAVQAAKLKEAQQDLEDLTLISTVTISKLEAQYAKLLVQSKNRSLSEQERIKLAKEAQDIDNSIFEIKSKQVDADIAQTNAAIIKKAKMGREEVERLKKEGEFYVNYLKEKGILDDADVEKYVKSQSKRADIEKESSARQEKLQNKIDLDAEKAAEKTEKAEKTAEESLKKKNELIIKEMEQQLRLQQALSERNKVDIVNDDTFQKEELRLANAFIAEKKLLDKKYETEKNLSKGSKEELLEIETRHKADLAELNNKYNDITEANLKTLSNKSIKIAEDELAVYRLQHETRIADGQLLTDVLIQKEIERLTTIKDAAEEIERQRFLSGQITADEFRAYQLEAEKSFNDSQLALYKDYEQQKLEIKAINFENDLEIRRLQGESTLTLRLEQLDREQAEELRAAEKNGADKNKIYQKYELAKSQIQKEAQKSQLAMLADGLGTVADLLGKNTAAGKAAGIAQATINTYLGVSQVLAAPPSGPEPLNTITKAIAIATTIGTGIANVANIVKVPTKFESGGKAATAGGNRHSSGGTKYYGDDGNVVELEQGENWYVLNRNASSAIGRLSDINQRYGGVSFHTANNSGFYEDGGLVGDGGLLQRSLTGGDIAGVVLQAVDTAFRNVTIVTKVTDVISETGKYNSLVDGANI